MKKDKLAIKEICTKRDVERERVRGWGERESDKLIKTEICGKI